MSYLETPPPYGYLGWCSGNVNITDWMYGLFGVLSSIPVNVKTVQMLFNVVWIFLFTVWMTIMRLSAELITRHTIWNSGKFLREGYMSPWHSKWHIFHLSIRVKINLITHGIWSLLTNAKCVILNVTDSYIYPWRILVPLHFFIFFI